jgi:hypothetical protein
MRAGETVPLLQSRRTVSSLSILFAALLGAASVALLISAVAVWSPHASVLEGKRGSVAIARMQMQLAREQQLARVGNGLGFGFLNSK